MKNLKNGSHTQGRVQLTPIYNYHFKLLQNGRFWRSPLRSSFEVVCNLVCTFWSWSAQCLLQSNFEVKDNALGIFKSNKLSQTFWRDFEGLIEVSKNGLLVRRLTAILSLQIHPPNSLHFHIVSLAAMDLLLNDTSIDAKGIKRLLKDYINWQTTHWKPTEQVGCLKHWQSSKIFQGIGLDVFKKDARKVAAYAIF